ncbi:MAG TPA: FecR domain-containing protein [Methylovirgula sp.]|nr:FecR domain-containing protein [Methylovirgula sp.]
MSRKIDPCIEEAFGWVVRLIPGEATIADLEEFELWSAQSAAHARAFTEARRLWDASALAAGNVFARGRMAVGDPRVPGRDDRRIGRRAFLTGAATASVATAGYLLIRPPFDLWPPILEVLEADYKTSKGEQRRLSLSDVSIEMNTETRIAFRREATAANRIELISGEGVFTAGHQVFEVVAGQGRARASNAIFDMRRDHDAVRVTCTAGEVNVACGREAVLLAAREQVRYSDEGIGSVSSVDPEIVTAWQDGFLVFHDTPLSEVIAETNRYRQGRIILMNAELGRRRVNARFRLDRIDDVVTEVTNAFGARATSLPAGLVILS